MITLLSALSPVSPSSNQWATWQPEHGQTVNIWPEQLQWLGSCPLCTKQISLAPKKHNSQCLRNCFCLCFTPVSLHLFFLCLMHWASAVVKDWIFPNTQCCSRLPEFPLCICLPGRYFPSLSWGWVSPFSVFSLQRPNKMWPAAFGPHSYPPPEETSLQLLGLCSPQPGTTPEPWTLPPGDPSFPLVCVVPELSTEHSRNSNDKKFWS